ncbi:hypothetical protein Tco_0576891 [Tanacetum coccineum]
MYIGPSVRLTLLYILIQDRLLVILEGAKVFDKKGIHPSDYNISFKLADNVPKQGGIFGDCGMWVCIFLYRLAHGLSFDVEDLVDVSLAYHEKMELVAWAEEEAGSPYLKTPPVKPRRKGIKFPCKNLFGEFLHCDSVTDEVFLHDNCEYKGLSLDGYIDVGGSSTCCDLVHESVVYDGPSLLHIEKECFANDVVLDARGSFVPDTIVNKLPLLLKKKKGRSRVNVTRKRTCLYRTKIMRLRKGLGKRVSSGANYGKLVV